MIKRILLNNTWIFCFLLVLLSLNACKSDSNQESETTMAPIDNSFIKAPFEHIEVPFEKFSINAEKADTMFAKSGSFIVFPPNSFVDKEGNVVNSKLEINYREFSDAIDIFISGIPMTYDTLGKTEIFESFGMFEVNANVAGEEVFVNPESQPQVYMISDTEDLLGSIYFLDTVQKKWIPEGKGRMVIAETTQKSNGNSENISEAMELSADIVEVNEPVEPNRASGKRPLFEVNIPKDAMVPDLLLFKNTKFEIDITEKNYDPKEADKDWDGVAIEDTKIKGLYLMRFWSLKKGVIVDKVSYRVRPVFEEEDFQKALRAYNDEYEKYQENRLAIRNRQEEIKQNRDRRIIERKKAKHIVNNIYRNFGLRGMGILNIDKVMFWNSRNTLYTNFIDKNLQTLEVLSMWCVLIDRKRFIELDPNRLFFEKDRISGLFGLTKTQFVYITNADYKRENIDWDSKIHTFTMRTKPISELDYDAIIDLLKRG